MTGPADPAALVGTLGAYDACPGCGHARVKHLSPPRGGCVAATWAATADGGAPLAACTGLCTCTAANTFPAREETR